MAKRGRKSTFKPEYVEQAYKLCLLGATDEQIADILDKDVGTLYRWQKRHPDFRKALNEGKRIADARIAESLYHRALGYTHPEEKIFMHEGQPVRVSTLKHYPPDTVACIFWLKNRQKEAWRDKHEHDISGEVRHEKIERVIVDDAVDLPESEYKLIN